MKNIVLGGVLGGVVLFLWGGIAHMLLPLGSMGMQQLPHEGPVITALDLVVDESGLYLFPWMDLDAQMSKAAYADWEARYREGPVGMILFRPQGGEPMSSRRFATQFGAGLASAFVAAILLSYTSLGFLGRLLFATSLGLFSWLTLSVPYWNWYGVPGAFTLAAGIELVVGWFLAGLVLAALGRKGS